jgi:hypothetical protein
VVEPPVVLAEAVLRLLRHLAGPGSLLLILEDLHWADDATLAVVEYLADHAHEVPVLICVTCRDDEGAGPGLTSRLRAPTHRLGRLSDIEVTEMISACAGGSPETPGAHDDVARAAQGLPLIVEDLLGSAGAGLPRRYADNVLARAERLAPQARRALRLAALVGESVDSELDGLDSAIAVGLLVQDGSGIRFRHALTRAVLVAAVTPAERVELAAAAGDALLATGESSLDRDLRAAALLADGGDPERALQVLRTAAQRATAAGIVGDGESALRAGFDLAFTQRPAEAVEFGQALADVLLQAGQLGEVAHVG